MAQIDSRGVNGGWQSPAFPLPRRVARSGVRGSQVRPHSASRLCGGGCRTRPCASRSLERDSGKMEVHVPANAVAGLSWFPCFSRGGGVKTGSELAGEIGGLWIGLGIGDRGLLCRWRKPGRGSFRVGYLQLRLPQLPTSDHANSALPGKHAQVCRWSLG